jgi:hypothetical protein
MPEKTEELKEISKTEMNILVKEDELVIYKARALIERYSPEARLTVIKFLQNEFCLGCGNPGPCSCNNDE